MFCKELSRAAIALEPQRRKERKGQRQEKLKMIPLRIQRPNGQLMRTRRGRHEKIPRPGGRGIS